MFKFICKIGGLIMSYQDCQMFCYQCEQTAHGTGCAGMGVCGKTPNVAALQDLLVYVLKGLSAVAIKIRESGANTDEIGPFICQGLFATVTNVDFDEGAIALLIKQAAQHRDLLAKQLTQDAELPDAAIFTLKGTMEEMIAQGKLYGMLDKLEDNQDIQSLKNALLLGLKGIAAYADHAAILGQQDPAIYDSMQNGLASMLSYDISLDSWVAKLMECGQTNLKVMELLDKAHTIHYGHPVPTKVSLGAHRGKAILISGHDLKDLELLLKQTEGKGVYVYSHGEMLPAHGYPELHKYDHFCGHYGTAWQNQHKEFAAFPGSILMTTNCIQKPLDSYKDRIFTTGLVEWPDVVHIGADKDFSPVINKALSLLGFESDIDKDQVMVGFAHNAVLGVAEKIVELVKAGKIRHFFLVAGCDGAKPGRNYYTEFVEKMPQDCLVLTLACGKFRFYDKKLGDIEGIPRLLDIGQCNDAYSAIQIAVALAKAFDCGVNDLPLSFVLSWYEQKAVAVLLTLFSLGIQNIRLGPTLPAFVTPNVLNVLVEKFNISPITSPDEDLKDLLGE
jgi:hydroxylamine reductase